MGLIANFFNRITGVGSSSGPKAQSVIVGNATTGVVHTVTRLLGSTSTISLIGSTANLSVSDATILLAVAPDGGTSQNLSVRETNGYLAVEYPLSLVNTEAYASVFSLGSWNDATQWRDSHIWSDGAYATITAPILTKTSTAGANPIAFTIALDNTVAPGMYWHLQVASDASFTNILSDDFRLITLDDFNGSPQFNALKSMANGPTFVRLRIERDDGVMSNWSNGISDTLSGIPIVTFDPGNRNTVFTRLFDNNLRMTGVDGSGANGTVLATRALEVGESGYAEFVSGPDAANGGIGAVVAGTDFVTTNTDLPGGNKTGLYYGASGYVGYGGAPNYLGNTVAAVPTGGVIGVYVKNTSGNPRVWLSLNGSWLPISGNPTAGAGIPIGTTGKVYVGAFGSGLKSAIAHFSAETQQYRGDLAPYGANADGTVPAAGAGGGTPAVSSGTAFNPASAQPSITLSESNHKAVQSYGGVGNATVDGDKLGNIGSKITFTFGGGTGTFAMTFAGNSGHALFIVQNGYSQLNGSDTDFGSYGSGDVLEFEVVANQTTPTNRDLISKKNGGTARRWVINSTQDISYSALFNDSTITVQITDFTHWPFT